MIREVRRVSGQHTDIILQHCSNITCFEISLIQKDPSFSLLFRWKSFFTAQTESVFVIGSMGSIQNTVHYCSVSKGNRILYAYSGGDNEIENLASLCLEKTPPFHKWYFETVDKRTYGFLIEDGGYVYFVIVDEGLGSPGVLQFLEHLREEFKNAAKKGSRGSFSGMNAIGMQEQLVPVIRQLITSLENVAQSRNNWNTETPLLDNVGLSPSPSNVNGQIEVASSTKAPLLGKSSKQEKKKARDHVIAVRDVELEEHRKSADRGVRVDPATLDSNNQSGAGSSISSQKDLGSMRIRSSSQSIRVLFASVEYSKIVVSSLQLHDSERLCITVLLSRRNGLTESVFVIGSMGSIQNTVHYCSTPPFHKWYFETVDKRTYGFLIEDGGYVYFVIVDEGLGSPGVLQFLEHLREEFKNAAKKGSRGSFSGMNAIGMQEQLVPVIRQLINFVGKCRSK
ncbi:hypothetical protein Q3G72_007240 [Acer saccharum]|nr:hypothetical protein Q3G72_007240 [Acer saccharum]